MLKLNGFLVDKFDDDTQTFRTVSVPTVYLEHSLISISKWEAIYKKPFLLHDESRTDMEIFDYIKCMLIKPITDDQLKEVINRYAEHINEYINDARSATTFSVISSGQRSTRIVTSELIYYWMVSYNIPWEAEKWHINRLMTLIRIFSVKNDKRRMPLNEIYRRNAALNAQARRRAS